MLKALHRTIWNNSICSSYMTDQSSASSDQRPVSAPAPLPGLQYPGRRQSLERIHEGPGSVSVCLNSPQLLQVPPENVLLPRGLVSLLLSSSGRLSAWLSFENSLSILAAAQDRLRQSRTWPLGGAVQGVLAAARLYWKSPASQQLDSGCEANSSVPRRLPPEARRSALRGHGF